jgi:hypothetical protein
MKRILLPQNWTILGKILIPAAAVPAAPERITTPEVDPVHAVDRGEQVVNRAAQAGPPIFGRYQAATARDPWPHRGAAS